MTKSTEWRDFYAIRPRRLTSGAYRGLVMTGKMSRRWNEYTRRWRYCRRSEV